MCKFLVATEHILWESHKTKSSVCNKCRFISSLDRVPLRLFSLTRFTHCSAQTGVRRMYGVTGCRYTRSTSTKEIPLPQHMQSCHYTGSLNWRKRYRELIAQKQRSQLHHTARCSTRLHSQSERRRLVILSTTFYTDPVADSFHTRQDQTPPF